MKITADTNVLLRAVMQDDPRQGSAAAKLLAEAESIAVSLPTLCEFVWVLLRVYKLQPADVAEALQALMAAANVAVNRAAVEAGLAILTHGGDFADGVIAFEGQWLGGEVFVSFDKKAVALLNAHGMRALLLEAPVQ